MAKKMKADTVVETKAKKSAKAEKVAKAPKAEKVAKAPKAEKVAKAPKAEKVAKAPKADVSFFTWLQGARARQPLGEIITALKADKKINETSQIKNIAKRYEGTDGFDAVVRRYEQFCQRGSQAGLRSRAVAA